MNKGGILLSVGCARASLKGEDASCVEHEEAFSTAPWSLFAVADGHAGQGAAACARAFLGRIFRARLSKRQAHGSSSEKRGGGGSGGRPTSAGMIRQALAQTYLSLDHSFCATASESGCTLTTAVVAGRLLTVANVGDSAAYLDTGSELLQLTTSHRLADNPSEVARLRAAGALVAPAQPGLSAGEPRRPATSGARGIGPLRFWPCGVTVSRVIGDPSLGPHRLPHPAITQLLLPPTGGRLILASDGLWNAVPPGRLAAALRAVSGGPQAAADAAVAMALAAGEQRDDITVLVVDMLPPGVASFHTWLYTVARLSVADAAAAAAAAGECDYTVTEDRRVEIAPAAGTAAAAISPWSLPPLAMDLAPAAAAAGVEADGPAATMPQQEREQQQKRNLSWPQRRRRLPLFSLFRSRLWGPKEVVGESLPPSPAQPSVGLGMPVASSTGGSGNHSRLHLPALPAASKGAQKSAPAVATGVQPATPAATAEAAPVLLVRRCADLSVYGVAQAKTVQVIAEEDAATWAPRYFSSRSSLGTSLPSAGLVLASCSLPPAAQPRTKEHLPLPDPDEPLLPDVAASPIDPLPSAAALELPSSSVATRASRCSYCALDCYGAAWGDANAGAVAPCAEAFDVVEPNLLRPVLHVAPQIEETALISPFAAAAGVRSSSCSMSAGPASEVHAPRPLKPAAPYAVCHEEHVLNSPFAAAAAVGFDDRGASSFAGPEGAADPALCNSGADHQLCCSGSGWGASLAPSCGLSTKSSWRCRPRAASTWGPMSSMELGVPKGQMADQRLSMVLPLGNTRALSGGAFSRSHSLSAADSLCLPKGTPATSISRAPSLPCASARAGSRALLMRNASCGSCQCGARAGCCANTAGAPLPCQMSRQSTS